MVSMICRKVSLSPGCLSCRISARPLALDDWDRCACRVVAAEPLGWIPPDVVHISIAAFDVGGNVRSSVPFAFWRPESSALNFRLIAPNMVHHLFSTCQSRRRGFGRSADSGTVRPVPVRVLRDPSACMAAGAAAVVLDSLRKLPGRRQTGCKLCGRGVGSTEGASFSTLLPCREMCRQNVVQQRFRRRRSVSAP
jgi:hypothetical protein